MSNKKIIFVFLFLLFEPLLQGQSNKEEIPLIEILEIAEKKFDYRFNYAVETIENITVIAPSKYVSILGFIRYLEKATPLKFTTLLNNFISIEPKENFLLCGYIKDALTKKPITAATILGEQNSTITNEAGYFELEVNNETDEINIQHLGYQQIIRPYNFFEKEHCIDIYLNIQVQELSEIILTSFLTKGIDKMSDGSFKINFSDFGILPGLIEADALQTVQALPGIQSINETVSNINIRGGTNDQNLMIWDGIKMYQSGHFFGLVSIFNPMITQKVRLIKNGSTVDYTDGVSGTIIMETDDTINDKFKGSFGLNLLGASGFIDVPLGKKSSIQVAARNGLVNLIRTPTYTSYAKRILQDTQVQESLKNINNAALEFDFNDISFRWLWNINDKNKIRMNFISVRNEFDYNEDGSLSTIENAQTSNLFQNSLATGLFYERDWTTSFTTEFQFYKSDYNLKGINADLLEDQRFMQENQVSEIGLKLNTFYNLGSRLKLLNGYQYSETQITDLQDVDNPLYRLKISEVLGTHGLYSQLNFSSLNERTNFSTGARLNYISQFDKYILEPRISFNNKLLKHLTVEVLGEYKHQLTSQIINFQNDFLGIERRRWQLSNNDDLPIIRSKQASLGLHLNKNGWLVSAETYFKYVTGITTQSQGFQNQFEFVKSDGSYQAYGFDFLIRKKINKFNSWFSYSHMENHYTFKRLSEYSIPNNLEIYHAITFGASYSLEDFKFSAGFNWHTGKPTTMPISGNEIENQSINYEAINSSRLKDYFRLDLSTTYKLSLSKGLKSNIGFSLWNTLNRNNIISNYYRINRSEEVVKVPKVALKITPNISFKISF